MQQLFKRYFWAIRLVGIAALALVVAGGINDWLASRLFAVPVHDTLEVDPEDSAASARAWGRVAAEEDAAQRLSARHVFDLDPPEPAAATPTEAEPATEEEDKEENDGELEETELAIDLVGTMVSRQPASSVATLEVEGKSRLGWRGSELLDGKAKIVEIAPRHIVLEETGGDLTVVKLWDEEAAKASTRGRARPSAKRGAHPRSRTPTSSSRVSERIARSRRIRQGVHRAGAYNYTIDRSMLAEEMKDLARLEREARSIPSYEDRAYNGIKLVGVRPGSLYRALGIRSGDVITAVNGRAIDSPTKGVDLFEQLQSASKVAVQIQRRGRDKTLNYTIK